MAQPRTALPENGASFTGQDELRYPPTVIDFAEQPIRGNFDVNE
jgi:hypothetical protein